MKKWITMCFVMMIMTITIPSAVYAKGTGITVSIKTGEEENPVKKKNILMEKQTAHLVVRNTKKEVTRKATYKSSNKAVISVTKKGKLRAKKPGKAAVTVKYKGKTKKIKFVVKPVPSEVGFLVDKTEIIQYKGKEE